MVLHEGLKKIEADLFKKIYVERKEEIKDREQDEVSLKKNVRRNKEALSDIEKRTS